MDEVISAERSAERSATVHIITQQGRWTFVAKLAYIHNTEGIGPPPKPHDPPFPIKAVLGAVEDMVMGRAGEKIEIKAEIESR
jgi:hypothetical protein